MTWRKSLRRTQVQCLVTTKLTSEIVRNGQRKITSTQEGLLLQQADYQMGRLPFLKPGSNEDKSGKQGSRVPVPRDRRCWQAAAWKTKCTRTGLVSTGFQVLTQAQHLVYQIVSEPSITWEDRQGRRGTEVFVNWLLRQCL